MYSGSREFYFIFFGDEQGELINEKKWWRVFTTSKFRHVKVIMQMGADVLSVDGQKYGTVYDTYYHLLNDNKPLPVEIVAKSYAVQPDVTVVKYVNTKFGGQSVWGVGTIIPSCVSVAKQAVGVNNLCVTPKGLFKWLIRKNGELIDGR